MSPATLEGLTVIDREAGQAFEKAAKVLTEKVNEPDDAANANNDAAKAYGKEYPEDSVRCLKLVIQQYCSRGNFRRAAREKENMGERYESEMGDRKNAILAYTDAANWYEGDGSQA